MHRGTLLRVSFFTMLSLAIACGDTDPTCDTDGDCAAGEVCVDGQCQQCRADADCPIGQRCQAGACVAPPPECASDAACGEGRHCEAGRCVATTATTPGDETSGGSSCANTDVFFSYDSATLSDASRRALGDNVSCVTAAQSVAITGMTDPRGVEEYNLALGERRANAVRTYLERLGVSHETIRTNSMGEEMATGTDEESWSRDRRATVAPR